MKMATSMLRKFGAISLLLLAATPAFADNHAHKSPLGSSAQTLKAGEKWATDDVLRQGMEGIRQTMLANQAGIDQERLTAQEYRQLAATVEKNIADIIKNCKLSKEADQAFHKIVLIDMSGGVQLMRESPKPAAQRVGAMAVIQSLRNYGQYFQHPGWSLELPKAP